MKGNRSGQQPDTDGTKKLAIKRSLLAEVKRHRRSQAMLDLIAS